MPKPLQRVVFVEKNCLDFTETDLVTREDALRYASELAKEETEALLSHLATIGSAQRSLDARFAEKFAGNPGVVTRAEFEDLRNRFQGVFSGDYTIKHVLDLRAEISKLEVRLKDLEADARRRGVMLP